MSSLLKTKHQAIRLKAVANDPPTPPTLAEKALANSSTIELLEKYCLLNPTQLLLLREIFLRIDEDHDFLITPNQMFDGIQLATHFAMSMQQTVFLMEVTELTARNRKETRGKLAIPPGGFPNDHESLKMSVIFSHMSYKRFVLVATLAQRICGLSAHVKDIMKGLDPRTMADSLRKAKGLFHLTADVNESHCISLEELSIEMKSAGNFSLETEESILTTLQSAGVDKLTYIDFCLFEC